MTIQTSRRTFLKGATAAGAALIVGLDAKGVLAAGDDALVVNPFVRINADGTVTAIIKHIEFGQGTSTGLTTLIAEELDANWDDMRYEHAAADNARYANLMFGMQGTGGSTAIANSYMQYRQAGAAARAILEQAAANRWGVLVELVTVHNGIVTDGTNEATFADLVEDARALTPPAEPRLKTADRFRYIGNAGLPRKDSAEKTNGTAQFAIDIRRPNMVRAVVAHPPQMGAVVASFDASAAEAMPGVYAVKQIPTGIAVYAGKTWQAMQARAALEIEWDMSGAETRSSDQIIADYRASLDEPGLTAAARGSMDAMESATQTVEAEFTFPFLAHTPLEPQNCVIEMADGAVTVWDGCQFPSITKPTVAAILEVPEEKVTIHTTLAGGSFGRRATPNSDYVAEAAMAAKAIDGARPVQLVWSREDDVQGGYYRPAFVHRVKIGLGDDGMPTAWQQDQAGKAILVGTPFEAFMVKDGVDATSVEGVSNLPYTVPNMAVTIRNMQETPIPVLWWRSVGHTHTAYSTEIMVDMAAQAAGQDAVAYREKLLADHPRHLGVLRLAAQKAGWGEEMPAGKGRGIAVHESFSSFVAHVVDVTLGEDGEVSVDRIVCAVDCGTVVNPDVVKAQLEGGSLFGLSSVMREQITLTDGVPDQSNYWDTQPLRISETPTVEVHVVPSTEPPTGVGEPGVPTVGPALANAIAAAGRDRPTTLPMSNIGVSFA